MNTGNYNKELKTIRHYYDSFSFLLFFRIMEDEKLLEEYNISSEDWEHIRNQWVINHEDLSGDFYFKSKKDEFKTRSRYNKLITLKQRASISQKGLKEVYESIKLKWHDNKEQRDKYLEQQIAKAKKLHEIFEGQKKAAEKNKIQEFKQEKRSFTVTDAYECIASLELSGANIPDYDKLTLGKYDALSAVITKRNKSA